MTRPGSTEGGDIPAALSRQQFSEPPVIGHTYDIGDASAPVFIDAAQPRVSTGEFASGHMDMRCARPGRRGCRAQPVIVRAAGRPPLIVLEHKRDCSWLKAMMADRAAPHPIAADGPEMAALLAVRR